MTLFVLFFASFEMLQRKFAIAAAECYAADAAWMLTASMVNRGGIDYSLETAACKVFSSEASYRAANEALQILGGIGYQVDVTFPDSDRAANHNTSGALSGAAPRAHLSLPRIFLRVRVSR